MTQEDLNQLAIEHAKTSSAKSQAKYSFNEGFKKALELVEQAINGPLYTHYDYDEALAPLLSLLNNK